MEKNIIDLLEKGHRKGYNPGGGYNFYDFNFENEHIFFVMSV